MSHLNDDSSPKRSPGATEGTMLFSYLLAGLLAYGGLGWLVDQFLGTWFMLPIGLVLGMGLSVYLIAKRYGSQL